MVDFESYNRYGPSTANIGSLVPDTDASECRCPDCRENEGLRAEYRTRFDEEASQRGEWEDEQYILCPPRVLGYVLREKQWAQLQVTSLKSIPEKDSNNSWSDRLVLADGDKTKKMILELVMGHGTNALNVGDGLEVDDIIAKKGKGLVILLYGMTLRMSWCMKYAMLKLCQGRLVWVKRQQLRWLRSQLESLYFPLVWRMWAPGQSMLSLILQRFLPWLHRGKLYS